MTSVECFIDDLKRRGVEWIAALCGHGLDPLFYAAKRAGIRIVDTRNEQSASYIAEAYGRLTRKPGVCAVSSGIAHVNAMSGLVNAHFDGAPMLLVSGAAALRTAGMGHFQDLDQVALAASVTRYARVIDHPERTLQMLDDAWRAASPSAGISGPSHLTYPMDIQSAEVDADRMIRPSTVNETAGFTPQAFPECERPVIVAGSGVYYSGEGPALLDYAERHSIPVVTPIWDRGVVDAPSPVFCGVVGAATGGARLIEDSDCLILAGAVTDYRLGYLHQTTRAVRIDHEWQALAPTRPRTAWLTETRIRRDRFRQTVRNTGAKQAEGGMHALHVIEALERTVREDTALVIDGGSIGQWAHQLLTDRYPSHWLTCGRSGVVGYGIAGAMAARLAFPDRGVVLLSGDGAFTFTVAELECAVRQKLPFVAVVADDQSWGITQTGHIRQFGEGIGTSLGPIAFDRLAESLGARGVRVTDPSLLAGEIERGIDSCEVTVIHARIVGGNP
ncbi:MAG: thiamine pyrophosphate-binding protein [Bryobacterales bacterium]|nr:thiamine pyrophosphate-binding protein [Bryobacterales bacterium]